MIKSMCKSYNFLLIEVFSVVVLAVFTAHGIAKASKVNCEPVVGSNCSCKLDNNQGTFDLQGLVEDTIIPRFAVNQTPPAVTYLYDPCREFSYGECDHAAVCNVTNSTDTRIARFDHLVYDYQYDDTRGAVFTIKYTNGEDPSIKTSVLYQCNAKQTEAAMVVDIETERNYQFRVISSYFCNQPVIPSQKSISFGTFLCITVPIIFLCYFVCGFLYLFFVKHESWSNTVPHHQFWCSLPGLIRDGASYSWAFVTCRSGDASSGYDQI